MKRPKDNWMRTPAGGYISLAERHIPPKPPDRGIRISRSKTLTLWVWFSYIMVGFFSFLFGKLVIALLIKVFTVKPF